MEAALFKPVPAKKNHKHGERMLVDGPGETNVEGQVLLYLFVCSSISFFQFY